MATEIGGRFRIEERIGEGGMGEVFRARDTRGESWVALKLMRPEATSRTRFEREARLLASIDHPAVVRHIAHGVTQDASPWLAMAWLEGCDLSERLERGPLSIEETVAMGRRLAEGLAVVHANGIIHRDLKPENLFLVDGAPEQVMRPRSAARNTL